MEVNENRKRKRRTKKHKDSTDTRSRKIPKECLENALKLINDPSDEIWKDRSNACEKTIHQYQCNNSILNQTFDWDIHLRYARSCLVRRDWINLTKVLLLYKPQKGNDHLLSIFAKYASICLAYTNQPLLKSLLQSFGCKENTTIVLREWTSLTKEKNEEVEENN